MFLPRTLDLVSLLYSVITVCERTVGANASSQCCSYRKTLEKEHNIPKTVYLHPEAGFACCEQQAYNPATATCCKVGNGSNVTEGLSTKVSSCCGLKAYDPLNEICCDTTLFAKPGPRSECCGHEAIDVDKKLCCGKKDNKTILLRKSSDHVCCGPDEQYNPDNERCCFTGQGFEIQSKHNCCKNESANVTEGLSTKVSSCCGLKAYDPLNEICCDTTLFAKPGPRSECCGHEAIDVDKKLCCGKKDNKTILLRKSSDHVCCGPDEQYNPDNERCSFTGQGFEIQSKHNCSKNESANVTEGLSTKVSSCCGLKAYDPLNEICCDTTLFAKPGPRSECCGHEAIDVDKKLCCGKKDNKTILLRKSSDHVCCGPDEQYNPDNECCCFTGQGFEIQSKHKCCKNESGVQQQQHGALPKCTEAQTNVCGSSRYNLKKILFCQKKRTKFHLCSVPGHCDTVPTVHIPHSHISCDGCVSERTAEQFTGLHRQNYCGTEVNDTEICCDGHRHPKVGHMYCCGTRAYKIKNQEMKCCLGTLYNLTLLNMSKDEVQCCGSALKTKQDVCCLGEDMEVLYSAKKGFRCCAHYYYNTSLWSCYAGWLSPKHHQKRMTTEPILRTMDSLNEIHLCEEIHIGIVASVSQHQHSIAFNNVLKIHGRNGTVTSLASPHILKTPDQCNFPKVTPGKTYFFNRVNMYTDFNHDSILQTMHFIFTKCSHHEVVAG